MKGKNFLAPSRQKGQALLYGIFMLIAGLSALYFMFNVGQLTREKTKLVTTADAVAYSAGLMHARALNYHAYNNRALLANEVLIAQMVSMASWERYIDDWKTNVSRVHPECEGISQVENGNYIGAFFSAVAAMRKFGPEYAAACGIILTQTFGNIWPAASKGIQLAVNGAIALSEAQKGVIQATNQALHAAFLFERQRIMQAIADDNYIDDGEISLAWTTGVDNWIDGPGGAFVRHYQGNDRTRFKDVTLQAAYTDPFVKERKWNSTSPVPLLDWCIGRFNEVRRRGGTEYIGLDQWHAVDTQSYHSYRSRRWRCRKSETPTGTGEAETKQHTSGQGGSYGGSASTNSSAHRQAVNRDDTLLSYSGLPGYYDLNAYWLTGSGKEQEPTLRHAVRLTRAQDQLRTTDGSTGQIHTPSDSRIAAYDSRMAAGVMAAVAGSEAYFSRPPDSPDNTWGRRSNRPRELGSLFNPYWQTRLVEADVTSQWLLQGVARP